MAELVVPPDLTHSKRIDECERKIEELYDAVNTMSAFLKAMVQQASKARAAKAISPVDSSGSGIGMPIFTSAAVPGLIGGTPSSPSLPDGQMVPCDPGQSVSLDTGCPAVS